MSRTISGSYANGVDLTDSADNPVTVSSTCTIGSTAGGIGLYGQAYIDWQINNSGRITATGINSEGVVLYAGGTVINTGSISGYARGVYIERIAGTVTNSGTGIISGIGTNGTTGIGVNLGDGGGVSNTGGLITGAVYGVKIGGAAGTLSNSGTGTISGTGTAGTGILFGNGGSISNSDGWITGVVNGIRVTGAAGTVMNAGTIYGNSRAVNLSAGGSVTNLLSGRIAGLFAGVDIRAGLGTVTNAGTLVGTGTANDSVGVYLHAGGSVFNAIGALIDGQLQAGVEVINSLGPTAQNYLNTVTNAGTIIGPNGVVLVGGAITNFSKGLIDGSNSGVTVSVLSTIFNYGSIRSASGSAIYVAGGGQIVNALNAIVEGSGWAVKMAHMPGSVSNFGSIHGTSGTGVYLLDGGYVTNASSGVIADYLGGTQILNNFGSVRNSGTIIGTRGNGIYLGSGGDVTNAAGGVIRGSFHAVEIKGAAGTIVNAGTLIGGTSGNSNAIEFTGSFTNRLIIEPGAAFVGKIVGGSGNDTLELDGDVGNSLTVDYNSLGLTNFENVVFDNGGDTTLAISNASGTLPITVSDFATAGQAINLTMVGTDASVVDNDTTTNRVTIAGSLGTLTLQFDATDAATFMVSSDNGSGINLAPLCFCRGTRILTERGEVAVEDLRVGDLVRTVVGALKPIIWIGVGRDLVTRANKLARPVIVRQSALADNVPVRDMRVTHGHALYIDDALIPVENLVNHRSILWDDAAQVVEYYHLELENHDVVLADGAPAETYYDAGNRALFHNTRPGSMVFDTKPTFAPVLNGGERVDNAWARLFARAGGRIDNETTDEADPHLMVAGARIDADAIQGCTYRFELAEPPAGGVRLCSRSGVPSLLGISGHDHRCLGVAVARIELRAAGIETIIGNDAALLQFGGCHPPEAGYSWTDGDLELSAQLFAHFTGPVTVTVHTQRPGMRYPREVVVFEGMCVRVGAGGSGALSAASIEQPDPVREDDLWRSTG